MNTRSGLASEATSVATRRSARCSCASRLTSTSFDLRVVGEPALAGLAPASVRSMPLATR